MGEDGAGPGRAGWVRKQFGRTLLRSDWKERYIRIERGRLLIYQRQDDAQSEETVDLGKYQRCQEMRGFMKKRTQFRLALVRRPGMKVSDRAGQQRGGGVAVLGHRVATAASDGMQRIELGGQTLIVEDSTSEEQSKGKVSSHVNKNRPILMPKMKPSNVKGNDGSELSVSQEKEPLDEEGEEPPGEESPGEEGEEPPGEEGEEPPGEEGEEPPGEEGEEPPGEEGEEPPVKEGEEPAVKEGEEPAVKEGEEPAVKEGEESPVKEGEEDDLSCTTETVSDSLENQGEPDLQTKASLNTNEIEKQPSEMNSISSLNGANLSRVKCASLGDILSESKRKVLWKKSDACYANLKNENVEKMEGEIALELKVTQELLQQVTEVSDPGNEAAGEQHLQSNVTQGSWSTRSATQLLNEAMAKWTEADKVLQELKDLKELCKKSKDLTSEERERRKNLLTVYRRSVP
ncbi:pleckstrin homology domain-containing family O member 2-like [Heptranchias perlo]|uniref:pleckstrin homology domain-containing family O member 2-like n=1 Tax=Heptranchias perlo TaxID=212740 RepID=UPI00355A875D